MYIKYLLQYIYKCKKYWDNDTNKDNDILILATSLDVFKQTFIANCYLANDSYNDNTLYIFHNIIYSSIVSAFSEKKVVVTGGSGTRHHVMSPLQFRLSLYASSTSFALFTYE